MYVKPWPLLPGSKHPAFVSNLQCSFWPGNWLCVFREPRYHQQVLQSEAVLGTWDRYVGARRRSPYMEPSVAENGRRVRLAHHIPNIVRRGAGTVCFWIDLQS